jgi:predicted MFS family arabinose efflux permease
VLSQGPGWRWVLFVNIPVCLAVVAAAFLLVPAERGRAQLARFDALGAVLVTTGMLLLVYALVEAPEIGWGATRTIGGLVVAAALLLAFAVNEQRSPDPLFPFSILRIKGLAAADATQLIAFAGFISLFFFLTLYMQNVLGYSPIEAGSAYLPVTLGIGIAAGICSMLIPRLGTRPIIVAGALVASAGMFLLSDVPVAGSYVADLLPGLVVMSFGLGAIFVTVTAAANAGVPSDKAGLAAGLMNTSLQVGAALGLAVFSALATARIDDLLAHDVAVAEALTSGFQRALLGCSVALLAAALIAMRAPNTRSQEPPIVESQPSADMVVP